MKFTDKLTIAIPVFERKDYIEEAILSVLNQTVTCKLIVIDNGSSHNYFQDICVKHNLEYFRNETNIGLFPNWNKCFEYAKTEFVMILGDDDILCENYVEIFLDKLNLYPTIDVFFSDFNILLNSTKEIINHKHILPFGFIKNGFSIIEYGIKYGLGYPLISSIVKKRVFKGFYTLSHGSNDWLWVYENAVGLDFYGEDNKLLFYRYHNDNDTKNMNTIFICQLSIIYIYSKTLSIHIAGNQSLLRYLNKNIRHAKLFLFSKFDSNIYFESLKNDNLYSYVLINILSENRILKFYLKLPLIIRKINYKILQLLKLA